MKLLKSKKVEEKTVSAVCLFAVSNNSSSNWSNSSNGNRGGSIS